MDISDFEPYPANLLVLTEQFFLGFKATDIFSIFILLLLLIASGMVSGAETAFFSLKPADLKKLRNSNLPKDKLVLKLREKPKQLLATILISNNFINVGIVILSTFVTTSLFNVLSYPVFFIFFQVVVITSFILIFGEIAPKMFAHKEALMISNLMSQPLYVLEFIFKPMTYLLVSSTSIIDRRYASRGHNISMSELSDAIELTVDESVPEDEKMILKGIAALGEKEASDIMLSRVNVTALDSELSFSEVLNVVKSSGFSRIPVYEETFDTVLGVLYVKDLLPFLELNDKKDWAELIRPAFFIPENKRINDLLQEFREKKIHLAIVVDEYGGTAGIITLEDIIEEIVGEISDEFDKEPRQFKYRKLDDNSFLFEAKVPLNDMVKILELEDNIFEDIRGESDSLGGLILEIEGKMPQKGSVISFRQFEFTIMDADNRRIKEVKLSMNQNRTDES